MRGVNSFRYEDELRRRGQDWSYVGCAASMAVIDLEGRWTIRYARIPEL